MQNVFVTGATGFIGRHLVNRLLQEGVQIHCLVRNSSIVDHLQTDRVHIVRGNLDSRSTYESELAKCDTVFHLAGMRFGASAELLNDVNGIACGQLADACAAMPTPPVMVFLSSLAAAGPPENGRPRREDDPPAPISNYGRSKRLGEIELQKRADRLPITIIRPGIVFGPNDLAMASMYKSIYRFRIHIVIGFRYTPQLSTDSCR